ncbi:probable rRNA maturation factor [Brevinema andersonii]|uniref:Endoribonuclease YbeY n=1 Tax=Brevinema andersonii TaxID=34097 RepID=A0A1I1E3H0_BREAD|nr:rRNA maturation RNase YbeY [Brevinema andersonii]SFB81202.1 probable rRNA maturation factor [Brevinema andersonii]
MINIAFESQSLNKPSSDFLTLLETYLENILIQFDKQYYECSIFFCNDDYILKLNKQYRNKNASTDVLSFAQHEGDIFPGQNLLLGDIVISTETAKRQAQAFGIDYEEELARLSIHGLLHLLGFDHERGPEDELIMFQLQDQLMDHFMLKYKIFQVHI